MHARARPPNKTEQQNGPLKERNRSTRLQPRGRDLHLPLGQTEKRPSAEIGGRPRNPASCRRHRTNPLRTGIPRKETGGRIARTGREPEKARTKTGTGRKQTERRKGQGKKGSGKGKKRTQKQRPGGRREGGLPQAAANPSRGRKKKGETKRLVRKW